MKYTLLLTTALALVPMAAEASRIDYAGEWFNLRDPANDQDELGNDLNNYRPGITFTGWLELDTGAPDGCAIATQGCYYNSNSPFSLTTDGHTYESGANNTTVYQTINPTNPNLGYWGALTWGHAGTVDGAPLTIYRNLDMFITLWGEVDSTSIVPSILFANAHRMSLSYTDGLGGGVEGYGYLTAFDSESPAPVPLPAALPLFLSGLGGLGLLKWLRHRRADLS